MSEKVKVELEYPIKTSTKVLYNCLSTPSGLSGWFADDVNIKNDNYTFFWDGSEETARLVTKKNNESIKFQWEDDEGEKYFFELTIKIDSITKDVALMVVDFSEEDEIEETKLLWDNQISELKQKIGG